MAYDFQAYLDKVHTNWYQDDALLQHLLSQHAGKAAAQAEEELTGWGGQVAGPLRALAEESARPENRPRLRHFDAYNHRIDEVVLPPSTLAALAEVQGRHRLGAVHGNPHVFYTKVYLYNQNGEAGVGCSMACTDGLVRALEALGDRPLHRQAVHNVRNSTVERVYHGAQFVTEIQGGSDVPANALEAIPDGDGFRLKGQKWFCSNVNADYFLVTGRPQGAPQGSSGVGLFLVPAYLDEGHWQRNGYTLDRLKDKLGTRELATAEVTFDGALGYSVGPLDKGISNVVKYVLVTSRFACTNCAASLLRQAERIVTAYTDFRTAFGKKLMDYPLVREKVSEIQAARRHALGAVFELVRLWARASQAPASDEACVFRIMMSLAKAVLTHQCTNLLHDAILLLAGNGIEERFSSLPRLYRDAIVYETWEGPHNVLFNQALSDLLRFGVDPADFVRHVAGQRQPKLAQELERVLRSAQDPEATLAFARIAPQLVRAMGERVALQAIG